jgi:ubiquinone/menaquinone biosynthesis C-methylase UbiE
MEREEALEICMAHGKRILDIGAGPLAIIAAKEFDCFVTCIDVDQIVLKKLLREIGVEGLEDRIDLENADAAHLPFKDNSFDVVSSYGALHHTPVDRRESFIQETFRVAAERLCVLEYKRSAFPHEQHEFQAVDVDWLERRLGELGEVEKRIGKEMDLYICHKK